MPGFMNFEGTDIRLARQHRVPVLITAAPDRALAVARTIAANGDRAQTPPRMVMWNGAAIVRAALRDGQAERLADDRVLVVRDVHLLNDTEQAALLLVLYDDEEEGGQRRIIATSSVCLYDRVKQGTFNANLFYRLNHIHLVSGACGDHARAVSACCSERAASSLPC